jgi:hypothetical protein
MAHMNPQGIQRGVGPEIVTRKVVRVSSPPRPTHKMCRVIVNN